MQNTGSSMRCIKCGKDREILWTDKLTPHCYICALPENVLYSASGFPIFLFTLPLDLENHRTAFLHAMKLICSLLADDLIASIAYFMMLWFFDVPIMIQLIGINIALSIYLEKSRMEIPNEKNITKFGILNLWDPFSCIVHTIIGIKVYYQSETIGEQFVVILVAIIDALVSYMRLACVRLLSQDKPLDFAMICDISYITLLKKEFPDWYSNTSLLLMIVIDIEMTFLSQSYQMAFVSMIVISILGYVLVLILRCNPSSNGIVQGG